MTAGLWYVVAYSLVIGTFMVGWWATALSRHLVPEVTEGSREIWFHVLAEMVTGAMLIGGAVVTIAAPDATWSGMVSALGLGLVVYSLIASPGYYVDRGDRPMVVMFATIWMFTVPAVILRFV